jgi:restriction endonuclease
MFDIFTEEIELTIKSGIANLYWYHGDLKKAWLRAGVASGLCDSLFNKRKEDGSKFSKRQLMDMLYEQLRTTHLDRRLEVSRNFVRFLVEHVNFVPQEDGHRIEVAERCALKLRQIIDEQNKERDRQIERRRQTPAQTRPDTVKELTAIQGKFTRAKDLPAQQRGYELEKIFAGLMRVNEILVQEAFRIEGEQIDGAIKYEGHYYLIEAKWTEAKTDPKEIASFYYKVEGKLGGRGIFISINGYTDGVLASLPRGKELRVLLLDGIHLAKAIFGPYSFRELLDHSISYASVRASIYCPHLIE